MSFVLHMCLTMYIIYVCLLDMPKFIMSECQESQHVIHTEVRNSGIELTDREL